MTKNKTITDWFLEIYWYNLYLFSAWRKGVISYHISIYDSGGEPFYKIWKDCYYQLNAPKSAFTPFDEDKHFAEQTEVEQNYVRKYKLTNQELGQLHMSFSPRRVPGALSFYEVHHAINKYKYKQELNNKNN